MEGDNQVHVNYIFLKSGRPALVVQGMEYLKY